MGEFDQGAWLHLDHQKKPTLHFHRAVLTRKGFRLWCKRRLAEGFTVDHRSDNISNVKAKSFRKPLDAGSHVCALLLFILFVEYY